MKKTNKKGFTLAELLVVVAIIAVLVAIAIPIFTSQLEKAREATDVANIRAAYAEATTKVLSGDGTTTKVPSGDGTTVEKTTATATTPKMVSNGAIDKLSDATTIGSIDIKNITINNGQEVTVEVDEKGTVKLSGGATVSSTTAPTQNPES